MMFSIKKEFLPYLNATLDSNDTAITLKTKVPLFLDIFTSKSIIVSCLGKFLQLLKLFASHNVQG